MKAKVPKCVACYEPVTGDIEHLFVAIAGALCGRCVQIAGGAAPFWIYPGDLRPVVVQAKSHPEAVEKVKRSPKYDGGATVVMRIDDFERYCRGVV